MALVCARHANLLIIIYTITPPKLELKIPTDEANSRVNIHRYSVYRCKEMFVLQREEQSHNGLHRIVLGTLSTTPILMESWNVQTHDLNRSL